MGVVDGAFAGALRGTCGQHSVGGEVDVGAIAGDAEHALHFGAVVPRAGQRCQVGEHVADRFVAVEVVAGVARGIAVGRPEEVGDAGGDAVGSAFEFDEFVVDVFQVQVRAPNRPAFALGGPVDVAGVDGEAAQTFFTDEANCRFFAF